MFIFVISSFVGGGFLAGTEWVDPEDPTVIAENELLGAAAAIEAAAKKLEQLKPRAKPKVRGLFPLPTPCPLNTQPPATGLTAPASSECFSLRLSVTVSLLGGSLLCFNVQL